MIKGHKIESASVYHHIVPAEASVSLLQNQILQIRFAAWKSRKRN